MNVIEIESGFQEKIDKNIDLVARLISVV